MRIPFRLAIGILAVLSLTIGWGVIDTSRAEARPLGPDSLVVVDIDIKPGSDPNSINCNNANETITVAILTTDDFDATAVDHTTVTFEGASETHIDRRKGVARRHVEDVDLDGDLDLLLHFRLGETDLDCDSALGILTGETFDGTAFEGMDDVNMIG